MIDKNKTTHRKCIHSVLVYSALIVVLGFVVVQSYDINDAEPVLDLLRSIYIKPMSIPTDYPHEDYPKAHFSSA